MGPPAKKCKGCGSTVSNPVICAHCGTISHPGPSCLARSCHPWFNGRLLNCDPSSSGSHAVDIDVTGAQSVQAQSTFPTVDALRNIMKELIRSKFDSIRQDIVTSIRSELVDIRSITNDLDTRVRQLEQISSCPPALSSSSPAVTEEIIGELNDRQLRAKNLIIHGLPETPNTSPGLPSRIDREGVTSILSQIQPSDYADITLHRIGEPKGSAPRPLCVGLKSSEVVINILRGKSRYSGPCKISDDKTMTQRRALDQLRMRLRALHEGGEDNWTIRYIHGVPTIVERRTTRDPASKNP